MDSNERVTDDFYFFATIRSIYSNWHPSPFVAAPLVGMTPMEFSCGEQFMMVVKALVFHDYESVGSIMDTENPRRHKSLGRSVRGFDDKHWASVRGDLFYVGLLAKFEQNPEMRDALIQTGDRVMVEAAPWDTVWGVGLAADDPLINNPVNWKGENLLGNLLMEVRGDIGGEYAI